jgi:hypothetical protein
MQLIGTMEGRLTLFGARKGNMAITNEPGMFLVFNTGVSH